MRERIVLAYSGGLDTSVILTWLRHNLDMDVYAYCCDLGQNEDLEAIANKAKLLGAKEVHIDDCRADFVRDYVFPVVRANTLYEGMYPLGTAIARPLIAQRQVAYARRIGATALAHGATGKGNDQLRFEYGYAALAPDLRVIAPWRMWDLNSRPRLLKYAREHQIPIASGKEQEPPYSLDANLYHTSSEGKVLEDPWVAAPSSVYQLIARPEDAPDESLEIVVSFAKGDAIALDDQAYPPFELLDRLNRIGAKYGIGRLDMLETRSIGTKSRGIYETPGGTILLHAHRAIEQATMDGKAMALRDSLIPQYAQTIYQGFWFSPEREMLQALIDKSQDFVCGDVRLKLYKGSVSVEGRRSQKSLYNLGDASFDHDGSFTHDDATGYITLTSLRLKQYGKQKSS